MKLTRARKKGVIPLNAMSDVAFLLLIFIMLVSLINYRKEIKIDYPEARYLQRTSAEKNLEIWIDKNGQTYLDGSMASLTLIESAVIDAYTQTPSPRVHVIADKDTPFHFVNDVLSVLQLMEYRVVSFVVKEDGAQ
ncbi:MAG: hypothetical protein Ta2A_25060 [Treponemataceae bacterium]|nr:MAG: hypothetical protein Ta2A_25060 [Treponemataceae bacterium]